MLNTSTYLCNSTPLANCFAEDMDCRHPLLREGRLAGTPNLGEEPQHGARLRQAVAGRTEALLLAPIWIGSAAAVLTALVELVRSV